MWQDILRSHLENRVRIEDNSEYVKKYEHIRTRLKELLGDDATYIEHVGTTAVNDITANPVIDIAIAVSTPKIKEKIKEILVEQKFLKQIESPNDEILLLKGSVEKPEYYLHIAETQSAFYKSMIRFRDELKLQPKRRDAYVNIHVFGKLDYLNDLEKYNNAKTNFIKAAVNHYGVHSYDEKIHAEVNERHSKSHLPDVLEKIARTILTVGAVNLAIKLFCMLIFVFVYDRSYLVPFILILILHTICMAYISYRAYTERTDSLMLVKRIAFISFGALAIINYIINIVMILAN